MAIDETNVMGYEVFSGNLNKVDWSAQKLIVNTINQYSYCIAEEDGAFKKALRASDVLLPDGVGIVWAAKWLKGEKLTKIAGADLHEHLLGYLQHTQGHCFYMGSSVQVLEKIKKRVANDYPNVKVGTYSPPYKTVFSPAENVEIVNAINGFGPDVVFVGMTAPKQEKWVYDNQQLIDRGIVCSIGAVFDFYAGTVERPSQVWQKMGLEWLGRLLKEPKRMWKRYIYYGAVFGYRLINYRKSKPKRNQPA
ncbi:N-acetylglucosaminyldiphosphoundecaprenol N-acetyl-beta-D-mannosaminyltransferase [Flavobacteriaceae bacterium MAR_2009_75]|nr:N-acetylglucosaminyldiphosphoundecaprenol N-acetyl-beta-D-mannosaminyltransferase [Flavobacteriaceae bacterium MAR_2009_75]